MKRAARYAVDNLLPVIGGEVAEPRALRDDLVERMGVRRGARLEPVEPASEFPEGQHPVILFFHYTAMSDGAQVTFAYYRNDALMEDCTDTWLWGLAEDRDWGQTGWAALECNPPEGWEPGSYDIRVFIESRLHAAELAQEIIEELPGIELPPGGDPASSGEAEGAKIGRYTLLRRIGEGGVGERFPFGQALPHVVMVQRIEPEFEPQRQPLVEICRAVAMPGP